MTSSNSGRGFKQGRGTGDSGQSSLYNNERRWKDDDTFNALGATDELSSYLGVCGSSAQKDGGMDDVVETLTRLQCCLQDVGAHLATPPKSSSERKQSKKKTMFDVAMVEWINAEIDRYGDDCQPFVSSFYQEEALRQLIYSMPEQFVGVRKEVLYL
ncbi:hypothetical protein B9Z55_028459 [Caenorhabditis nigoni]|nr:hypothetical protein B9Z55_028459 [Caenorhabditis nigoni]